MRISQAILPVKVLPAKFESSYSYLLRISEANGYPSPTWLLRLSSTRHFPRFVSFGETVRYFAQWVNLTEAEAAPLRFSILEKLVTAIHVPNQAKICPHCLIQHKFADVIWQLAFASVCPYHNIKLIDYCPECTSRLIWRRPNLGHCQCGANLTCVSTEPADDISLNYNKIIWAAAGRDVPSVDYSGLPEVLQSFSLNELCNIFRFLHQPTTIARGWESSRPKSVSEAIQAFEIIHSILSSWPLGLNNFLDGFRNNDGTFQGEGLQQAFGAFYRCLYKRPEFNFIANAFESYVRTRWTGVIDRKYRRTSHDLKCAYSSLGKVASKYNVSRVRLNKLMEMGMIVGERKHRPSGRFYTILNKCEVRKFGKFSKHMINKEDTCHMMGISKSEFYVLVEHRIINPIVKAGDHGFSEWWFDRRKIKALLEKIIIMVPKLKLAYNCCSFSKMCQTRLTNKDLLPDLLQSVIKGHINVVWMRMDVKSGEFRLSSLYFNPVEIAHFRNEIIREKSKDYSIPEAAIALGVKQQVAYHLVNTGFLKCHEDSTGLRRGRIISPDEIKDFKNKYIPLAKIARLRSRCSRPVMFTLLKLGISPAIGGGVDSCRQVFYLRSDLPESFGRSSSFH